MARIDSLSIFLDGDSTKDKLAESYGKVIENIEQAAISARLKNTDLSGDPTTGTVEAKRIQNTDSQAYGTARSGGKGQHVLADPVVVAIDVDKELINEVEEKDVKLYGVDGLIAKKAALNQRSMIRELERAFFACAKTEGAGAAATGANLAEKVEAIIQKIETTKNDYVDGVPRDMIHVVMTPKTYGQFRNYLDTAVNNANVNTAAAEMGTFHGVSVYSSVYLPTGAEVVAMVEGAIAQPVMTTLDEPAKFPASNAYHFGIFYSYGTKAVMKDLIFWDDLAATAGE